MLELCNIETQNMGDIQSPPPAVATEISADCIIVGAGFSGCYSMHMLRQQGYSAKIIDAGTDFGGVWHFNKYPGAAVDSEVPLYQLSVPKTWQGFNFAQKYPNHREMQTYFTHVGNVLDLRRDTIFNHFIIEANYDNAAGLWRLKSDKGLRATARYAIFATGTTNTPYTPPFPGLHRFRGQVAHTRSWPADLCLGDKKRIALIGQGCTGTQVAQEIAKLDAQVTAFIRTPSIAYPLGQQDRSMGESERIKMGFADKYAVAKRDGWATCSMLEEPVPSFHDCTPAQRRALWEKAWAAGGVNVGFIQFPDVGVDLVANAAFYEFWREKTAPRIKDAAKREILAPREQPLYFMAKRPVVEIDYYEMMDRENVTLVNLKQSPIKEFVETGIVTETKDADGTTTRTLHEFDLVIMATGYDSMTGDLLSMNIRDKHGVLLEERWKSGVSTHLGMMVPGMPNAFMLYGPQAPGPLTNGPTFIETQVDFMCSLLAKAKAERRRGAALEVTEEAAEKYQEKLYAVYDEILVSKVGAPSWWVGTNIPGKKKEALIWFGGVPAWREECEATLQSWDDFVPDRIPGKL